MIGWFLFGVPVVLFLSEVVCSVLRVNVEHRPVAMIGNMGRFLFDRIADVFYMMTLLADVLRFLRRLVNALADLFDRIIPREHWIAAWHGVCDMTYQWSRICVAPIAGILRAIPETRKPLWMIVVLPVVVIVSLVLGEMASMATGIEAVRPSRQLDNVILVGKAAYEHIASLSRYIGHVKELFFDLIHFLFGWIPVGLVRAANAAIFDRLVRLYLLPGTGTRLVVCRYIRSIRPNDDVDLECKEDEHATSGDYFGGGVVWSIILISVLWIAISCCGLGQLFADCMNRRKARPADDTAAATPDEIVAPETPGARPRRRAHSIVG